MRPHVARQEVYMPVQYSRPETESELPYRFVEHEVQDARAALLFLSFWWTEGYEYVEGLPVFLPSGMPDRFYKTAIHVLFKKRLPSS